MKKGFLKKAANFGSVTGGDVLVRYNDPKTNDAWVFTNNDDWYDTYRGPGIRSRSGENRIVLNGGEKVHTIVKKGKKTSTVTRPEEEEENMTLAVSAKKSKVTPSKSSPGDLNFINITLHTQ